jgi:hypothetical protein
MHAVWPRWPGHSQPCSLCGFTNARTDKWENDTHRSPKRATGCCLRLAVETRMRPIKFLADYCRERSFHSSSPFLAWYFNLVRQESFLTLNHRPTYLAEKRKANPRAQIQHAPAPTPKNREWSHRGPDRKKVLIPQIVASNPGARSRMK